MQVGDITNLALRQQFDAVVCTFVLQSLNRDGVSAAFDVITRATAPGGLVLLAVYAGTAVQVNTARSATLLHRNEAMLTFANRGWAIEHHAERQDPAISRDGRLGISWSHSVVVARNPAEAKPIGRGVSGSVEEIEFERFEEYMHYGFVS